jgi:DNA-binding XRE family transcriptional regulator
MPHRACNLSRLLIGLAVSWMCPGCKPVDKESGWVEDADVSRVPVVGMGRVEFHSLLLASGLTRKVAAERLGVATRTIHRWERGHSRIDQWKAREIRQVLAPGVWAKKVEADNESDTGHE